MKYVLSLLLVLAPCLRAALLAPAVFPLPQEMALTGEPLVVDETTRILLPTDASAHDVFLGRELAAELSDRYAMAVPLERVATVPASGKVIVLGSRENPLVRALCDDRGLTPSMLPGPEGYLLQVDARVALVVGADEAGAFYGMQSMRELTQRDGNRVLLRGARIKDWPAKPFRGVKLYLPGRDNIGFFKRFVRDFMARHKMNQLILELNASMRLDRHPELNASGTDFARSMITTRRDRPVGPRGEGMDSTHYDNADGGILEKDEVAEIVRWARQYHIEVIPELPTLSHAYYLLTRHPELAEVPGVEWGDAYCPSNPKSYDLLFDVLDEYIEVMQPKMIHVGHDEWRVTLGACPRCRDRDYRELYAEDLNKVHAFLAKKNIRTMIWGDHLIEGLRGKERYAMTSATGQPYDRPGGLSAEQVQKLIPKDILIANWFWTDGAPGQGEMNEVSLEAWGFQQFFGNMEPEIKNWGRRSARSSVLGGAPSSWAATTEFNFGKDQVRRFLGCANALWSRHWPSRDELTVSVQAMMPEVRERFSGRTPFSRLGDRQVAAKLEGADNSGIVRIPSGGSSPAIAIGEDASALIFVHACEKRGRNLSAYRILYNFEDTTDLIGHYEVTYDDGFVATVPVRYAVNVLEHTWSTQRPTACCYLADPVSVGEKTYFAFEWTNARLGKVIKSVAFKGAAGFKSAVGQSPAENALLLHEVRVVQKRAVPSSAAAKNDDQETIDLGPATPSRKQ